MTDKPSPEAEVDKALQHLRAQLSATATELRAAKALIARQASEREFAAAMDQADAYAKSKPLGLRLLAAEVKDIRTDEAGKVVASFGELVDASPADIVSEFIRQNDFMQPIGDGPTHATPEQRKVDGPTYSDGTTPVALDDMSIDELFDTAGPAPVEMYTGGGDKLSTDGTLYQLTAAEKQKQATSAQATSRRSSDDLDGLTAEQLLDGAGPAPTVKR